ncbi:hypothetical protein [Streptomyces sp. ICBB 8177]|uniref:hypothetical protein n=1 Tax=Streptomyces sp. ICBB 8177 TaxID=563922 RepID=UPI000D6813BE|nr:hypothetical protein [Streptomyces sp. ICBB 8177]PWI42560.1 hypothetical protein CK485_09490 [Streptomyces sp. ICBB 8177]
MGTRNTDSSRVPAIDPYVAVETLRAALDDAGIVPPSLKADSASPDLALVESGRARAGVAMRLAAAPRGSLLGGATC